jgi:hypothetical protein
MLEAKDVAQLFMKLIKQKQYIPSKRISELFMVFGKRSLKRKRIVTVTFNVINGSPSGQHFFVLYLFPVLVLF